MTAPLPIRFGPQTCTSLDDGARREWLVTDGLGGYAMGTVSGLRTRRYHGLLEQFDLDDGLPRWRWRVGEVVIEREVAMRHGSPSVVVVHRLVSGGPVRLELEALTTWR